MQVGVIYDFGVSKGGGDFVMLNILETLAREHDVTLITSNLPGLYEAEKFFGKKINLNRINVYEIKNRFIPHPYRVAYMAKKVREKGYDFFVLSDDIPKFLANKRVLSYVHYLHATRIKFGEHVMRKYMKTLRGKIKWLLHKKLFRFFYPTEQISERWFLVVNSRITMEDAMRTLKIRSERVALLHPPVASAFINNLYKNSRVVKEDLVVSIGWFEPVKGHVDLLRALALIKKEHRPNLRIIGFRGDEIYLKKIINIVKTLGIEDKVEILLDAKRDIVVESLLKAKAIVHPAPREHFGIAVVEGMAAYCIPIVRKGFNGPWLEILQEGTYGLGFETVEELAFNIENAVRNYENFNLDKIALRALEFDEKHFRDKFLEIVRYFLNQ